MFAGLRVAKSSEGCAVNSVIPVNPKPLKRVNQQVWAVGQPVFEFIKYATVMMAF